MLIIRLNVVVIKNMICLELKVENLSMNPMRIPLKETDYSHSLNILDLVYLSNKLACFRSYFIDRSQIFWKIFEALRKTFKLH